MVLTNVFKLAVPAKISGILLENRNLPRGVRLGKEGRESTNSFHPESNSHNSMSCVNLTTD